MKPAFIIFVLLAAMRCYAQKPELIVPVGHSESVTCASFSPDQKYIVTSGTDGTVKIWETESGKLIRTLTSGNSQKGMTKNSLIILKNISFYTPDGNYIINSNPNNSPGIWDAKTGNLLYYIDEKPVYIYPKQVSGNNKWLITTNGSDSVNIWDIQSGKILRSSEKYPKPIFYAQFSKSGDQYITVNTDSSVALWKTETGKTVTVFTDHKSDVNAFDLSPDGKLLVTASKDGKINIWETETGNLLWNLKGHNEAINSVQFNNTGKLVATTGSDYYTKIWDAANGKLLYDLVHTKKVNSVDFSPRSDFIITACSDKKVYVWDLPNGNQVNILKGHNNWVNSAKFSPDGKYIITASKDNTAKLWDSKTAELCFSLESQGKLSKVLLNPDGNSAILFPLDNNSKVLDLKTGRILFTLGNEKKPVQSALYSPDGKKIALQITKFELQILDAENGKVIQKFNDDSKVIISAAFSRDSKMIILEYDENVKIFDANNGALIAEPKFTGKIKSFIDNYCISIDKNTINVNNIYNGKLIYNLENEKAKTISSIRISPAAKKIISYYYKDQTLKIWDMNTGALLNDIKFKDSLYRSIENISEDGELFITKATGGTYQSEVEVWDLNKGTVINTIKYLSEFIDQVKFNSDNKIICLIDNKIDVWDSKSFTRLFTLKDSTKINAFEICPDSKKLISYSNDKIKTWDLTSGKETISIILLGQNDWVHHTPAGLFDASPDAMKQLYYVSGLEIIELNQLKDRYYEPGLLSKVMGYNPEPIRDVIGFNDVKLYPEINLSLVTGQQSLVSNDQSPMTNDQLQISLRNRGGGIGKVVVYINGKEIEADARGSKPNPNADSLNLTVSIKNNPLLKPGQQNEIEVKAYNAEGYLVSRGVKMTIEPAEEKPAEIPSLFIVASGVSDYTGTAIDLKYPSKDATDIATALNIGAKRFFGAEKVYTYLLVSDTSVKTWHDTSLHPTKTNLIAAFDDISKIAKPTDIIVVYLSGHGISWGGQDGDFFYLTQEAYTASMDAYNDPAIRSSCTMSSAELTELIKKVPAAQRQVLIIDACSSGKIIDNLMARRDISTSTLRALDRLKDRTGMHIITGCAADAVSYEASKYGQGLLTYSLLEGMKGAALREDKYVDVQKLFQYSRDRVPELATGVGGIQEPKVFSPYGAGSFDIGLLESSDKAAIPLAKEKAMVIMSNFQDEDLMDDVLYLEKMVDESLRQLTVRGATGPLIFIESKEFPDAYRISGRYISEGDKINVKVNVFKGKEKVSSFIVSGNKNELLKVADDIVKKAEEITKM